MTVYIHALREEGDGTQVVEEADGVNFYPRPPRGGRHYGNTTTPSCQHFYPRPPRGGRRYAPFRQHSPFHISIHALREEGDPDGAYTRGNDAHISIHALREEGDFQQAAVYSYHQIFLSTPSARRATSVRAPDERPSGFLSTPSARRATMTVIRGRSPSENFYPRPPRGGRLGVYYGVGKCKGISIHALREEGDYSPMQSMCQLSIFLSTPSARRATRAASCRVLR